LTPDLGLGLDSNLPASLKPFSDMVNRISSPNSALTTPSITGEERSISNGCISETHRTLRGAFIKGVLSAELTSDRNTTLSFGIIFCLSTGLSCLTFDPNRRVSFSDRSWYLGSKLTPWRRVSCPDPLARFGEGLGTRLAGETSRS